ncbi:MAG: hypothetical protein K6C12_01005 [Oscillospiraceae bacterium]|nr:hypothetical protein [Oscillospiraceae bacterium]
MAEIKMNDLQEFKNSAVESFRNIIPELGMTIEKAIGYWDNVFGNEREAESYLETALKDYFNDMKERSDYPDTIPEKPFDVSDLKIRTPEENALMHEEFDDLKSSLKRQWEETNGIPWPKYDHDIYSANGKLIRAAGSDYDAHHIHPLGMGGENVVSNITPMSAEVHYDSQGVHSPDSPYNRINQYLGDNSHD